MSEIRSNILDIQEGSIPQDPSGDALRCLEYIKYRANNSDASEQELESLYNSYQRYTRIKTRKFLDILLESTNQCVIPEAKTKQTSVPISESASSSQPSESDIPVTVTEESGEEETGEEELEERSTDYTEVLDIPEDRLKIAEESLNSAINRLQKNRYFRSKGYTKRELFQFYLPLMIKESSLDFDGVGTNGSIGYFQLKQEAIIDAKREIKNKLKVTKDYNPGDKEDNCILGIIYFEQTRSNIGIIDDIENQDINKFSLFSYNAGQTRLKNLLSLYREENNNSTEYITWDRFASWLAKKVGTNGTSLESTDSVYKIQYKDWLQGKTGADVSGFSIKDGQEEIISGEKVYISLRYVEIIEAIGNVDIRKIIPNESLPVNRESLLSVTATKDSTIWSFLGEYELASNFGVGTFQDLNTDKFRSGILNSNVSESIDTGKDYILPIIQKELKSGDTLYSVLKEFGIDTKHSVEVFEYNKKYNPEFSEISDISSIPAETTVYIPMWSTGFYNKGLSNESPQKQEVITVRKPKIETLPTGTFDFDAWIDSIEVIGDKLKGKVIILDPGHGGPDRGAIPVARDGNGNPILDENSGIKIINEKRGEFKSVKPGTGDGFLHVYESLAVVDISYRLALLLREQGATIYITRYNQTTGISDAVSPTTPKESDDIYSDSKKTWGWSRNGNVLRLRRGAEIANNIFKKEQTSFKEDNFYFFSIHTDSQATSRDLPITFKYYKGSQGTSNQGKDFAEKLALSTNFRNKQAISGGQGLYIVNPKYNKIENATLIEVANMNNAGAAYLLRQPGGKTLDDGTPIRGRQDYAEAIFDGIIKAVGN